MEKEEEEAVRNHCRRMISVVRSKQQRHETRRHKGARESRDWTGFRDRTEPERVPASSPSLICQGPEVQPVPPQLISLLRLKTFEEGMRRAAEVELHDPSVCRACEQDRASLALKQFIRRKKTQLQYQTLKERLSTHTSHGMCEHLGNLCKNLPKALRCPSLDLGGTTWQDTRGSQQPGVSLATTEERRVALATDEMRGYPDINATGAHLASPRCPFSDR